MKSQSSNRYTKKPAQAFTELNVHSVAFFADAMVSTLP